MRPTVRPNLELLLFETTADGARAMRHAGIRDFIVDWERHGKTERQLGYDTEIAPLGAGALTAIAAVPGASAWCRINRLGPHTAGEIERAVAAGAVGLFLPMVTAPGEVESFLRHVDGRCRAGILVETVAALDCVRDLAALPLDRVYFGLNDFAISRGGGSIFRAVLDGSVERARAAFAGVDFGFAGITAIDAGAPVPCARLVEEMARLDCSFSFLRRSFRRDAPRVGAARLAAGVQDYWQCCRGRDAAAIEHDRRALQRVLREACDAA